MSILMHSNVTPSLISDIPMFQTPIDLKNLDKETRMLYAGSVSFDDHHVFDESTIVISKNKYLQRLFVGILLRRIVRDIKQLPKVSDDITITSFPDGLSYTWELDGEKYCIVSHDSNAMPATICLGYTNPILTKGSGVLELGTVGSIQSVVLANRPYTGRDEWRKYRGDRNISPYMLTANIADAINQAGVKTEPPLINFQMIENMAILDVQPNQFTVGFDVMGQLYTLTVVTL